jgi:hypothetical protein
MSWEKEMSLDNLVGISLEKIEPDAAIQKRGVAVHETITPGTLPGLFAIT